MTLEAAIDQITQIEPGSIVWITGGYSDNFRRELEEQCWNRKLDLQLIFSPRGGHLKTLKAPSLQELTQVLMFLARTSPSVQDLALSLRRKFLITENPQQPQPK